MHYFLFVSLGKMVRIDWCFRIDTFEQDLKVAPIWVRKTIWNIAKEIEQ